MERLHLKDLVEIFMMDYGKMIKYMEKEFL